MTEVILHIYDVTNSGSDKTNNTIVNINKIFKDGIGLGGIFHSAVQVFSPFLLPPFHFLFRPELNFYALSLLYTYFGGYYTLENRSRVLLEIFFFTSTPLIFLPFFFF